MPESLFQLRKGRVTVRIRIEVKRDGEEGDGQLEALIRRIERRVRAAAKEELEKDGAA
jgi:hypothetical protein